MDRRCRAEDQRIERDRDQRRGRDQMVPLGGKQPEGPAEARDDDGDMVFPRRLFTVWPTPTAIFDMLLALATPPPP
jgi:hypothetical protein